MFKLKKLAAKILRKIKDFVKKPFLKIKDIRSEKFLKKLAEKKVGENGVIKVAFLVFEPETWEQQECVYEKLKHNPLFKTDVIVIPNFDRNFKVEKTYGDEKEFFEKRCGDIILAYDKDGNLYDLKKAGYDYIFYEDQYNQHYPKEYNTYKVCRYSRICCIPYGFTEGDVFLGCYTKDFFRGVYCVFVPCRSVKDYMIKMFPKGYKKGYRHYETLGYPVLEKYFGLNKVSTEDKILWTPRWSYDEKTGGSHFLEFKDGFKELKNVYPESEIVLRPHPMMFTEFAQKGYMSKAESETYLKELSAKDIVKSENGSVRDDFNDAEILITDFSSIIILFFLSGRPIIYSPLNTPLFDEFKSMMDVMYIADTWEQVTEYVKKIKNGQDYLKPEREKLIKEFYGTHYGSSDRIVDYLARIKY